MQSHACLALFFLASVAGLGHAGGQVLIDTRFGVDTRPLGVFDSLGGERRVTGSLPVGWQDNSAWARVWASYTPTSEGNTPFLRVTVSKAEAGRTCLCVPKLPDVASEAFYRVTARMRGPSRMLATLSVRFVGPPYSALWTQTWSPAAERWEERCFTFRLTENRQPIGFWIYLDGVGQTELDSLRLERIPAAEAQADLVARFPAASRRNLMRNSRFPLGLQSGWNVHPYSAASEDDHVQVTADPEVLGPSGAASLRLRTSKATALFVEPFGPTLAPATYTLSLSIRGTAKADLHVLTYLAGEADYRVVGAQTLELSGETAWQRAEIPFVPLPFVTTCGFRLCVQPGTYWIDGLKVEQGATATPYAPQMACEVALALPDAPESLARVQFDDEPAVVCYAVTGAPAGATVRTQVVTPYDETTLLPATATGGSFLCTGTLSYQPGLERHCRGLVRVEAWVEDAQGGRLSPVNELVIHRLRRPRYWQRDAPASHFGVHTFAISRHALMAKAIGANWVRLHGPGSRSTDWMFLEPEKGRWTFGDEDITRFRKYHLRILANLQTAPRWASTYDDFVEDALATYSWSQGFFPPRDLSAFATYVRTIVSRYKGVIEDFEFWNEPYWGRYWDRCTYGGSDAAAAGPPAMANYVRLMRVAYETTKAANPQATFVGFCSNITPDRAGAPFSGSEWTAGVVAAGGTDWCDAVSFHHYEASAALGFPGDSIAAGCAVVAEPFRERFGGVPKPLWMTEGSASHFTPLSHVGFYKHTLSGLPTDLDPRIPGDRLSRYVVGLLANGVDKLFFYSMHCHSSLLFGKLDYNDLVTMDGYLNAAAAALATTTWHLEDAVFVTQLALAEGVTAYLFEAAGRAVAAILPHPAGHAEFALRIPPGATAEDLFGNPVPVGSHLGQNIVYLATATSATDLAAALADTAR